MAEGLYSAPSIAAASVPIPASPLFTLFFDASNANLPSIKANTTGTVTALGGLTQEQIEDFLGNTTLVATVPVTKTYNDGANTITFALQTGVSIVDPGTGFLEGVVPIQTQSSATSKAYAVGDLQKWWSRTNGGVAMTDTLPVMSAARDGQYIVIANDDTTASITISAGAGQTFVSSSGAAGASTFTQYAGRRTQFVWNNAGAFWRLLENNNNLTKGKTGTTFTLGNLVKSSTNTNGNEIDDAAVAVSIDGTMASNSDAKLPTEKAVVTYAQPKDSDLTTIAGLTATTDSFMQAKASAWTTRTPTQVTADLNVASQSLKGLLAPLDKTKLDYIPNFVTDYGADPTGTTDIASAIAAVIAAGVSDVWVPAGTYKCCTTGTHVITTHLKFRGAGRKDTIFKTNHATNTAFQFRNWGGGFIDCGFDTLIARTGAVSYSSAGPTGVCVDFPSAAQVGTGSGSKYNVLERCDIYNQYVGVHSGDTVQHINDIEVRYNGLALSGQGGFLLDGTASANDKWLSNLLVQGNNSAGQFGVRATQIASLVMSGRNDMINAGNGLDLIPGNGESIPSVYVLNSFFDTSLIGLNIAPTGTGAVLRCHFTQSWFSSNSTAGVQLNSANVDGVDIVNCDIFGNGIGINALVAQDWSVSSSRLAGNTTAAIQTTAASGHGFSVRNNSFGTVASPQFGVNGKSINIQAGTYARYEVIGNRGIDTDTSGITDSGSVGVTSSNPIEDNSGVLYSGASLAPLSSTGAAALATFGRGAVTSGTAKTFLMTFRVPPNAVRVGQTFRLTVWAVTSAAGIPTWEVAMGTAGTTADTTNLAVVQAAQAANVRQMLQAYVQVVALGASNTMIANGYAMGGITSAGVWVGETVAAEVVASVATTGAWFITLSATCGTTGTITVQQAVLEVL